MLFMEAGCKKMKSWILFVACLMILATSPVGAVPVTKTTSDQDGVFALGAGADGKVTATLSGGAALSNYTIGIFDLNLLTADVNDPDFARQALQADRVQLLQEAGHAAGGPVNLSFAADARLALVVIYDATLREFSRGQNAYAPMFSVLGANGSHMINGLEDANSVLFSFAAQNEGTLFAGFFGGMRGPQDLIQVQLNAVGLPPVTPEPATLALVGTGLLLAGFKRRRKSR